MGEIVHRDTRIDLIKIYQKAEGVEFPPVDDDQIWCSIRGTMLPTLECERGCIAPEYRPVCWGMAGACPLCGSPVALDSVLCADCLGMVETEG